MSTDTRAQLAELRRQPMAELKQRWRDWIGAEPTRALLCRGGRGRERVSSGMCPSPSRARVHPEKVGSPIGGVGVAHSGRLLGRAGGWCVPSGAREGEGREAPVGRVRREGEGEPQITQIARIAGREIKGEGWRVLGYAEAAAGTERRGPSAAGWKPALPERPDGRRAC